MSCAIALVPNAVAALAVLLLTMLLAYGAGRIMRSLMTRSRSRQSLVKAVELASPLPVPDGKLFEQFRTFQIVFRPTDVK